MVHSNRHVFEIYNVSVDIYIYSMDGNLVHGNIHMYVHPFRRVIVYMDIHVWLTVIDTYICIYFECTLYPWIPMNDSQK